MSKSKITILLALAGAAVLLTSTAAAQTGATVTSGSGDSGSNSTSDSLTTEGGNVTNTNVTVTSVTQKWAAFYGQLNGEDILADSSGNNFYKWTLSDPSGSLVYAVPSGQGTPSSLTSISNPNTFLGSGFNSGVDSANQTFNKSSTSVGSLSNTYVAETFSGNSPDTEFTTGLYDDGSAGDNPVYTAEVNNDRSGFDGGSYDFQLLVGVGESTSTKTFDFYAKLN